MARQVLVNCNANHTQDTYLRRGGPPPGPAIWTVEKNEKKTTRLERVKAVDEASDLKVDQSGIGCGWFCVEGITDGSGTRNLMLPEAVGYM